MKSPAFADSTRKVRTLHVVLFAMIAGLPPRPALAASDDAQEKAADAPIVISGKVEDGDGKAVDGARVIVNVHRLTIPGIAPEKMVEQIGSAATNSEGRFEVLWPQGSRSRQQRFEILASTADGLLGFTFAKGDINADVNITARPTGTFHGRLIAADGQPIRGARFIPEGVSERAIHERKGSVNLAMFGSYKLPQELRNKWTATSSKTGQFELVGVPATGSLIGEITAGDLGTVGVWFDLAEPVTIRFDEPGALRFQLYVEYEKKQIDEIRMSVETSLISAKPAADSHFFAWSAVVRTAAFEKDGIVEFRGLLPSRFNATLEIGNEVPFVAEQPEFWGMPTVERGVTVEKPVPLLAAYPIRGRVKDAIGAPAANAFVTVLWKTEIKFKKDVSPRVVFPKVSQVRTDKTGEFQAWAPEGEILIHASRKSDSAFVMYQTREERKRDKTITIESTEKPIQVPDVMLDEQSK